MKIRIRSLATALALAVSGSVSSAEVGWTLDAGVAHSDNVASSNTNEVSDTLTTVGGAVTLERESTRITASLDASGHYLRYIDNTFTDDFVGQAAGSLVLGLVPDRLLWTIEDTYGQVATNQFAPVTPENRQGLNDFSTGPDVLLRFGDQSTVRLSGRYGDTRFENSTQIDTRTWGGSISFLRSVSRTSSWGVVVSQSRIEYDTPATPGYDQPAIYATLQSTGARQSLSVDAGINRVKVADGSENNPLLRLNWNRRITPSLTMNLDLSSEYQNTAQQFASQLDQDVPPSANASLASGPAASYYGNLSFAFQQTRSLLSIGAGHSEKHYVEENGVDEDAWYAYFDVTRRLTPKLDVFVRYRVNQRDYQGGPIDGTDEQSAELGLDWNVGKSTFLTLGYQRMDSDSNSLINKYKKNMLSLNVSYRQGMTSAPRTPAN